MLRKRGKKLQVSFGISPAARTTCSISTSLKTRESHLHEDYVLRKIGKFCSTRSVSFTTTHIWCCTVSLIRTIYIFYLNISNFHFPPHRHLSARLFIFSHRSMNIYCAALATAVVCLLSALLSIYLMGFISAYSYSRVFILCSFFFLSSPVFEYFIKCRKEIARLSGDNC